MAREFKGPQLDAINTRDKTLLVSAAAGSGKTATLIERIVRSIKSGENNIDKMLIVTFTKAAAAELRTKVAKALAEALANDPDNLRLNEQIHLLPNASISTIDSFCNSILKNNTERFGVSPKYRIADPIEADILAHGIWSSLIEAAFSGELSDVISAEDFEELASTVTSVKTDSALEDIFAFLYGKCETNENGVALFRQIADGTAAELDRPVSESKYMKFAIDRVHLMAEHYTALYGECLREFPDEEKANGQIEILINYLRVISKSNSYAEIREMLGEIISKETQKLTNTKAGIAPELCWIKDKIKEDAEKLHESFFGVSQKEWQRQIEKLSQILCSLAAFIEKFDEVFFEEKRRRALLEHSDITRLTYKSLYNEDGSLTDFALSAREDYSAVYIDEYQDVNAVQNKIFEAISTETNRFMVGDIKQSIYGFRSARPEIFANMKEKFPLLKDAADSSCASIFMSNNFRCDETVVDFVNSVFDVIFGSFGKSIGYDAESDRLIYSKVDNTASEKIPPEVYILVGEESKTDRKKKTNAASSAAEPSEAEKPAEPSEAEKPAEPSEAEKQEAAKAGAPAKERVHTASVFVANKIKELIETAHLNNGEPVTPKDIAILVRNDGTAGRLKIYADALKKLGIPARTEESKSFFFNSEIRLALCLLNAIDNPRKDIYLAGLMLSPLYSFTPDEMYEIKANDTYGEISLWQSLNGYCDEHPEFEKGRSFIKGLKHYRAISEGIKTDALILRLYHETGLLSFAKREGNDENLMLLYNYARKFEASSFEGLYNFIKYLNEIIATGASFESAQTEAEDAVTVITSHKSKGLEYPIVFIAEAETPFAPSQESNGEVFYSDGFGITMKTRAPLGYALVESPLVNVTVAANKLKSIEENLRVSYVAVTRARERLFIVGNIAKKKTTLTREKYQAELYAKKMKPSEYTLLQLEHFIDLIMFAEPKAEIFYVKNKDILPSLTEKDEESEKAVCEDEPRESIPDAYNILTKRFSFKYPAEAMTALPEKMSVSRLYPTVLDEMDGEPVSSLDGKAEKPEGRLGILPEFISGAPEEESARRGIATHTFLQFFDIEGFERGGAEKELQRLVEKEFISKENAARVRLDEIKLFKKSRLFEEMKHAKLYREFRFSVMLPAYLFTENEEKRAAYKDSEILLQGVIDCIIEDENGDLHLIDYKTDRLSRAELKDRSLASKKLSEKHSSQLFYYALAMERIFGKLPKTKRIYSLPLGDTVELE